MSNKHVVQAIKDIDKLVSEVCRIAEDVLYGEAQEAFHDFIGNEEVREVHASLRPSQKLAVAFVGLREVRHDLVEALRRSEEEHGA